MVKIYLIVWTCALNAPTVPPQQVILPDMATCEKMRTALNDMHDANIVASCVATTQTAN